MNDWQIWYQQLQKPAWTPDPSTISLIWTILYPMIGLSIILVAYRVYKGTLPRKILLPFLLNLVFNLGFTPILFGLQNLILASIDIILVLVTIIWSITVIFPHSRLIVVLQTPYLIWVTIATVLQLTITTINAGH